jgi:serine/threonine protein phosphatase 1
MFSFFRTAEAPAPLAAVPEGLRVYAVGDIHGNIELFEDLLAQIAADHEARGQADVRLIFVGDLIDRGPASAQVVERVRQLMCEDSRIHCIMGNHEELLLLALEGNDEALALFTKIGGRATLLSYGLDADDIHTLSNKDLIAAMRAAIPATHVEFINSLEDWIEIGDYLFVHAGIRPEVPIERQKLSDLRWIRTAFLDYEGDHGKIVVHGHTVTNEADVRRNRIGLDTGAAYDGKLTAICLEGDKRWFLSARKDDGVSPTEKRLARYDRIGS